MKEDSKPQGQAVCRIKPILRFPRRAFIFNTRLRKILAGGS
jgi:hypothetical protein